MSNKAKERTAALAESILTRWTDSFPVRKRVSRGNVAGGLVLLERLKTDFNLDIRSHMTPNGFQLKGATAVKVGEILKRRGETRPLAKEGGRTNSGLLANLRRLLELLEAEKVGALSGAARNNLLDAMQGGLARRAVELLNVGIAPFPYRRGMTTREVLRRILDKAKNPAQKRDAIRCLLGAGLGLRFPEFPVENSPASPCDFQVGNSVFRAALFPGQADHDRCSENLAAGFGVYLIVPDDVFEATRQSVDLELGGKVTVLSCASFISLAVDEAARFSSGGTPDALAALLEKYGEIGKSAGHMA